MFCENQDESCCWCCIAWKRKNNKNNVIIIKFYSNFIELVFPISIMQIILLKNERKEEN